MEDIDSFKIGAVRKNSSADSELTEEDSVSIISEEGSQFESCEPKEASDSQRKGLAVSDKDYDILYSPDVQRGAINNLIVFSMLMFTVPLGLMYLLQKYFFREYLELDYSSATLYAGILAILATYLLVTIFIRIAFNEEKNLEEALRKKN